MEYDEWSMTNSNSAVLILVNFFMALWNTQKAVGNLFTDTSRCKCSVCSKLLELYAKNFSVIFLNSKKSPLHSNHGFVFIFFLQCLKKLEFTVTFLSFVLFASIVLRSYITHTFGSRIEDFYSHKLKAVWFQFNCIFLKLVPGFLLQALFCS